jgi:hypothetical protein
MLILNFRNLRRKKLIKTNSNIKEFYVFFPLLVVYIFLLILYPFLYFDVAKFLIFQILFVLLPGYIFSKWFISEKLTKIQSCIFGYPVSIIVIFVSAWIGNLINIHYLPAVMLIFTGLSINQISKDYKNEPTVSLKIENSAVITHILFYSICVIVTFIMFTIPTATPTAKHLGLYYRDSLWTIGNTWSFIRGFPLYDSRCSDILFGYHMLQNIYQATVFNFTKIDPFNIHFYIEPFFDWFLLVFIVVFGGMKIAKLSLSKVIIFSVGLFFTSSIASNTLMGHMFFNPLSAFFGLPAFIIFIYYMISYFNKKGNLDIFYITILFIYMSATKTIFIFLIPVTLLIMFVYNLFKKQFKYKKEIILGICFIMAALLLKLTIYKNSIEAVELLKISSNSRVYYLLDKIYLIKNYKDIIFPLYIFLKSIVMSILHYWPSLLFFILFFIDKRFQKENKNTANLFMLVFVIITMTCVSFFYFAGGGPYFYMYSLIPILLLSTFAFDHLQSTKNNLFKILSTIVVIIGVVYFVNISINWRNRGWGDFPNDENTRIRDNRATIDYGEWKGMQWFKDNTKLKEVFFTDRCDLTHENSGNESGTFFGYSALTGRQAFAEGNDYIGGKNRIIVYEHWSLVNDFLLSNDYLEQEKLLREIPADYFIQSLRFNDKDYSGLDNLELVYENNSIKIFKILK